MEVILIDSGISHRLLNQSAGGMKITFDNGDFTYSKDIIDKNGHGTYCAEVMLHICKNISFYVIKIVGRNGYTSSSLLYKALEACKNVDARIICMSLSVIGEKNHEKISKIIKELRDMEKIVCVSVENGKESSFPANLNEVIGVKGKIFYNTFYYIFEKKDNNIVYFDSTPALMTHPDGAYKFFYGNSKANAVCAGIIAKILNENHSISVRQCFDILLKGAKTDFPPLTTNGMSFFLEEIDMEDAELFRKLVYQFNGNNIGLVRNYLTPVLSKNTGINMDNVICFLQLIEKTLKLEIDYSKLSFSDIFYLGNLVNYLKGICR